MLPPNPGDWAHVRLYVDVADRDGGDLVAGTLAAAVLAVPLALLAAKNVTTARILHFLSRRSLEPIRSVDILIWALI